jgi:hypothetical protein
MAMSRLNYSSLALVVLAFCASPVLAGPLATDANGMPGFTGSVGFSNSTLVATMDYAVFAPGSYTGNSAFKATDYIYAYQLFNTGSASVVSFTVGLSTGNGAFDALADPTYPQTGGIAPSSLVIQSSTDSVVATFGNPVITAGTGYSQVVIFASPNAPTFGSASVVGFGLSDQHEAPTPTPEPTSLALLGLLSVRLFRRHSR